MALNEQSVQIGSKVYEFVSFSDPVSLIVNTLILEGKTYPGVDFIGDVRIIMDIGANVGAASLWFSVKYPAAVVYAFEPNPSAVELLRRNVSGRNVECFSYGLFTRTTRAALETNGAEGTMTARVSSGSDYFKDGGSIVLESTTEWISEHKIARIDILKLDTEGCEVPILTGLRGLVPTMKVIHLEYHSESDRRVLDNMLSPTHVLISANVFRLHRGEMTYVAKNAFPSAAALSEGEIRIDI